MKGTKTVVLALISVALFLTGCSSESKPKPTPSAKPSASSPSSKPLIDADTKEPITTPTKPYPKWDKASLRNVVVSAERTLRLFARPSLSEDKWFKELEPHLTPDAAKQFAYTLPANVPVTAVTGKGKIFENSSVYVATVEVPTNNGRYHLLMVREESDSPWLAQKITPIGKP